jgi:hypothetical protein
MMSLSRMTPGKSRASRRAIVLFPVPGNPAIAINMA